MTAPPAPLWTPSLFVPGPHPHAPTGGGATWTCCYSVSSSASSCWWASSAAPRASWSSESGGEVYLWEGWVEHLRYCLPIMGLCGTQRPAHGLPEVYPSLLQDAQSGLPQKSQESWSHLPRSPSAGETRRSGRSSCDLCPWTWRRFGWLHYLPGWWP